MLTAPRRYHLTVDAYDRMIEAGVFPDDAHIELLEGVLYEMPPMGRRHQVVLQLLLQVFASLAAERRLLVQMPIILPDDSEPEPDLAVVAPGTPLGKPTVEHVVLAIEVAERSRGSTSNRRRRSISALAYSKPGCSTCVSSDCSSSRGRAGPSSTSAARARA